MKKTKSAATRLLALIAVAALLFTMILPVSAASMDAVNEAKEGVFLIAYCYPDPVDPKFVVAASYGTGFLVNETTVITCHHVIHEEDDPEFQAGLFGLDPNYRTKMEIRVYYKAGAYYLANEIANFANSAFDFTALKLSSPFNGSRQLTLCSDADTSLISPNTVYALGYPGESTSFVNQIGAEAVRDISNALTSKDVDTKVGNYSKLENWSGYNHFSHSATLNGGMSGGPLLNDKGQVVGVNRAALIGSEVYNYAVPISNIIDSLNITGIDYKSSAYGAAPVEDTTAAPVDDTTAAPVDDTTAAPELDKLAITSAISKAEEIIRNKDKYKADTVAAVQSALDSAKAIKDSATSQSQIDEAVSKLTAAVDAVKPGMNLGLIIGIAAAAVVLIALIIILIVVSSKKKAAAAAEAPAAPYAPNTVPTPAAQRPVPPTPGFSPVAPAPAPSFKPAANDGSAETGVLSSGSNETTVLGAGASETTVLSSTPYAKLTRKSNNEIIQVSAATFVIGKEKRKVNYCIEDNATISRSHAQIVKSGSKVCIVDLGSKNGTFVNGVKCNTNQATEIKSGDKITLSDEEFTVTLL